MKCLRSAEPRSPRARDGRRDGSDAEHRATLRHDLRFWQEGSIIETDALIADRYRLGDVVGRSLMSEVRRGEDIRLKRPVAVKLLRDDGNQRSVARFEQEAQILARLQHPNIVTVFDAGVDGAERFIVMEMVEGSTLRQLLDAEGMLDPERAAEIASALASAVSFAHDHGVVHRDVKPANVLLPAAGGVKLADMGIAQLLSPEALTMTLSALGTARYTSPEQARGDPLDGRSDIYSLGCVLFEMLTGRTPFDGNPVALSYAHMHTPAPRVRSINPEVPAGIDKLVAAMLEKNPANRPQSGEDVRRSLQAGTQRAAGASTADDDATEHRSYPMTALPARTNPIGRRVPEFPSTATSHQRRRRFAQPAAVIVTVATLAVVGLALAFGPWDLLSRGEAGQAAQTSPAYEPSGSSTVSRPPTVVDVYTNLIGTLLRQESAGRVSEHASHDLQTRAQAILDKYQARDGEGVQKEVDEFAKKLQEGVARGEVSSEGFEHIDAAFDELVRAVGADPPQQVVEGPKPPAGGHDHGGPGDGGPQPPG